MNIVYEDGDVAVLNKPAGIAVHPAPHAAGERTLSDDILARWPEIKGVGEDPSRPGIVHRLDKETSGIVVIAKTQVAYEFLKRQFQERKVKKTYLALVAGDMKERAGTISLPIGRSKKFGKFTTKISRGKIREAVTRWKVIRRYCDREGNSLTLLEVAPETGRTHQIRVHLAAIGRPVAGDTLYGGETAKRYREALGRHFLHAASLECELPTRGRLKVEADLSTELAEFLAALTPND